MITCPHCGLVLQTLDLPCPACVDPSPNPDFDPWTLHEFSQSFRTRHLVRPRTDAFVAELNAWLANQPGLVHVAPIIHRDHHGTVSGATLTCVASSRPATETFRFFRLPLLHHPWGVRRKDLGEVLNWWTDEYPDYTRASHQVISSSGVPIECWLLSKGPPAFDGMTAAAPSARVSRPPLGDAWTVFSLLAVLPILITISGAIGVAINAPTWVALTIIPGSLLGALVYLGRRRKRKALAKIKDKAATSR